MVVEEAYREWECLWKVERKPLDFQNFGKVELKVKWIELCVCDSYYLVHQ